MNRTNEKNRELKRTQQNSTPNIRWMLVGYDLIVYAVVAIILLVIYGGMDKLSSTGILQQVCLSALCIFAARLLGKIYEQVWNDPAYGSENTVAVHIRHLREKIEIDPAEPRYLKVVWGLGYKIEKGGA